MINLMISMEFMAINNSQSLLKIIKLVQIVNLKNLKIKIYLINKIKINSKIIPKD
jgi:hypothetical protein